VVAARSEAGDTLVEILLSMVVISLTAAAILGAFTTSMASSSEHKDLATLDAVLKSYVENATYQLGRQSPTAFVPCATLGSGGSAGLYSSTTTQGNYSLSLTGIQFWQPNNTWGTACDASAQPPQAELLTATAVNTTKTGDSESLQFSVSNPNYSPAPPAQPVFTGSLTDPVTAGVASTFPVFASGSPTPALSASGEPSWVTFVDQGGGNGTIFMQPPANASGPYPFTLTATNSFNGGTTVSKTFTIQVAQAPAITSASTDTLTVGTPLSFPVTATGVPTPALSASGLPSWATFTDNGNGTGTLAASNPVSGTYTISLGALNVAGSASQTFTLVVTAPVAPSFTSSASTTVPFGQKFTFNVTTTGNPTPSLSASGLPGWATFTDNGNGTGMLTGTPTASGATPPITFTATNAGGTPTQAFALTVSPQSAPTITAPSGTSQACVTKNTNFNFNVTGAQFQNGLTITSSGLTSIVVVFNNSTSLTVAATSGSKSASFTIKNPDGGQATSDSNAIKVSSSC
jgi:type II secretory pathway pseudopilin PulG